MTLKKFIIPYLLFQSLVYAQNPIVTKAKVQEVTVYFNGAEISQTIMVPLPKGTTEIIVKNVAENINESTIRVGAPKSVSILSTQFSRQYFSNLDSDEKSPPSLKKIKDSIALVEKELVKINNIKITETKALSILDTNQNVAGGESGLNVGELIKLVTYAKTQRLELLNSIETWNEREIKWKKTLSGLKNQLDDKGKQEEKSSSGKLILQVMSEIAGNVPLEIHYLTSNASWTPFYDFRAENITEPINMMYKAQIIQNTGIDWKKVKLTLSSGQPNEDNKSPELYPSFLYLYDHSPIGILTNPYTVQAKMNNTEDALASTRSLKNQQYMSTSISEATLSDKVQVSENQMNVSFDIDIPYDILSNGMKHSIALKEVKLPVVYKYYAAPRIEKEAFLRAEIKDYAKYNILPGNAAIIFENMYIGKSFVDANQTFDTLNLSLGRDKKIAVTREKLVDKSGIKFLSSNKQQTFTYEITIRNNKKETISILVKDQYPLSTDKDLIVELLQSDNAKVNKETGILTWDLTINPNETKKIRLSYSIKYPKNKEVTGF